MRGDSEIRVGSKRERRVCVGERPGGKEVILEMDNLEGWGIPENATKWQRFTLEDCTRKKDRSRSLDREISVG